MSNLQIASAKTRPAGDLQQLGLQVLVLASQASDFGRLGINVNHGLVLDLSRSVRVAQCVECLLDVRVGGTHTRQHDRVRVAAERVLQQTSEL